MNQSSVFVEDVFYNYEHPIGGEEQKVKENIAWNDCRKYRMDMDVYDTFWLLWDFTEESMANAVVYEADSGYCISTQKRV